MKSCLEPTKKKNFQRKPVIPQKCDDSPEYKIKEENAGEQDHPSI